MWQPKLKSPLIDSASNLFVCEWKVKFLAWWTLRSYLSSLRNLCENDFISETSCFRDIQNGGDRSVSSKGFLVAKVHRSGISSPSESYRLFCPDIWSSYLPLTIYFVKVNKNFPPSSYVSLMNTRKAPFESGWVGELVLSFHEREIRN